MVAQAVQLGQKIGPGGVHHSGWASGWCVQVVQLGLLLVLLGLYCPLWVVQLGLCPVRIFLGWVMLKIWKYYCLVGQAHTWVQPYL